MGKARRVDFYPDEWLAGTIGLDATEVGVYITACALIYSNGGPIPQDHLREGVRCHGHTFNRALSRLLSLGKLTENGGQISNKRCENELQKASKRIENARHNGGKGGRPPNNISALENQVGLSGEKLTTNHQPPTTNLQPKKDRSAMLVDFAAWYAAYPIHVGKKDAEKAYTKARASGATAEELLSAIERYRVEKPSYADWKHPATWLNKGCWTDDYAVTNPAAEAEPEGPKEPPPKPEELWPELRIVSAQ